MLIFKCISFHRFQRRTPDCEPFGRAFVLYYRMFQLCLSTVVMIKIKCHTCKSLHCHAAHVGVT